MATSATKKVIAEVLMFIESRVQAAEHYDRKIAGKVEEKVRIGA